jgi:hypothetical protein
MTFQPGLQDETEWVLRYRAPRMWNPLREHGEDAMAWVPGVMDRAQRTATSITALTVRFLFPSDTTSADVAERRGLGISEVEPSDNGQHVLVWRDPQPSGGRYEWRLKMTREQ